MIADPIFYALSVPAVMLLGMSKGGFAGVGMLALPLMALAAPPLQAAAIMLPILIVQDAFAVWTYRRSWDGANLAVLLPSAIIGILLGYFLAAQVTDSAVALCVGVISIVFATRNLLRRRRSAEPSPRRPPWAAGWFWGTMSGFTSMIAHAGYPPFQIFVLPQRLKRDVFIGTGVLFFALVNLIKVPPYLALGQFTRENLLTSATLVPLAIVSTWLGVLLVRRVSAERFVSMMDILLLVVGCELVLKGTHVFGAGLD